MEFYCDSVAWLRFGHDATKFEAQKIEGEAMRNKNSRLSQ